MGELHLLRNPLSDVNLDPQTGNTQVGWVGLYRGPALTAENLPHSLDNFELFSGLSDKSLLSPENILRLARSLPQQVDIQVRSQEYFELFNSILTLFYMVTWYLLEQEIIIKGLPLKQSPFVQ